MALHFVTHCQTVTKTDFLISMQTQITTWQDRNKQAAQARHSDISAGENNFKYSNE